MSEEHRFQLQMEQRPLFGVDVADDGAARAWRKRAVEEEVLLNGKLPRRMVLAGPGVWRTADLPSKLEADEDLEYAAIFLVASRQPDITRCFREGEVAVEEDDTKYRSAVILEFSHATRRWWRARRRVGTNRVSIGVFHGEWDERDGEGLDALDEDLRDWVDTSRFELTESETRMTPDNSTPTLLVGEATMSAQPPRDPKIYAEIIGSMVDPQLAEKYPTGFEIFSFCGLRIRQHIVETEVPFPIEDLIRAIASQEPPDAIALRHPGVANINGEAFRSVVCAVECDGRVWRRIVAVKFGPNGKPVGMKVFDQDGGPVQPDKGWIGVPPKNADVGLFVMGVAPPDVEA